MPFQFEFQNFSLLVIDYTIVVSITAFKFQIQTFMKAAKTIFASGNRLQPLVIDYQREIHIFQNVIFT